MTKPILDRARIVALVRQRVAATMAEHVGVDREGEAGALTNALKMPIDCISCKWPSPLGREYITTIGKLPAQLAQCPDLQS